MPSLGTVSWEVVFKVAVTIITKENQILFLKVHTGYKIIRFWSAFSY